MPWQPNEPDMSDTKRGTANQQRGLSQLAVSPLGMVAGGHAVWGVQYGASPPTAPPTKTVETVKVMYSLDRDDTPYRITVPHW